MDPVRQTTSQPAAVRVPPPLGPPTGSTATETETLSALIERTHAETKAQLEALAKAVVEAFKQALNETQAAMTHCAKTLHQAEEVAKSLSSVQEEVKKLLVTETATATAARRELWDEAARFRTAIYGEIRWFIRTPAIVIAVATVMTVTWLLLRPQRTTTSSPRGRAATAAATQKPSAAATSPVRSPKTGR